MLVLGIDPGSTVTGFGLVESRGSRYYHIDSGCFRTRSDTPMARRLATIHEGLLGVLERHQPEAVAIESIFRHKSSESALRLGQARGVALLAAGLKGYEPFEYNPSTVKSSIGANGKADKQQIAKMVCLLLGLKIEGPPDQTDALAIAITHCAHARRIALVSSRLS